MFDQRVLRLLNEAMDKGYTRREIGLRAAAMGISIPVLGAALAAARPAGAQDNDNPLGVDPTAPLNPYIFDGGFGVDYARNVNTIYNSLYPEAEINFEFGQGLGPALQPRFVAGNPPDVIDNSGANNLDQTTLVGEGQIADLADLMAAPAYDTEGATFADTLIPNSQLGGIFDGQQNILFFAYTVIGVWHSRQLFEEHGLTYPQTWDEMLSLCEDIKNDLGIAPWVTTGVHTQYMRGFVFDQLVFKHGGRDTMAAIDHLEEGAWLTDEVRAAADGVYQLAEREYLLPGFEGLDHTSSQTEWYLGRGVFLPCGSWLENESGVASLGSQEAVDEFAAQVQPVPNLTPEDELPFEAIFASAGENFWVPAQAANVQGGKEWMRLLFSIEGARFFSEATRSLAVVQGSAEGLDAGPALASMQETISAAGDNTLQSFYSGWYADMNSETRDYMGELLRMEITPDEFCQKCQDIADSVAADDMIIKYRRPDMQ